MFVLSAVDDRLGKVRVPAMTENLVPLLEVSGSFVRGCRNAARGVLVLAEAKEYGGIVAAERTAWEMWNELDYLLGTDKPQDEAVKVQVNGVLDVLELVSDMDYAPASMVDNHKEALARFERDYPALVEDVRGQRKKGRYHWSGLSRTKVVAPTESSKAVYKMLSWESHPDIAAIRDVSGEIKGNDGVLKFYESEDVDALVERAASSASECLLRAWNLFAHFWQQQKIESVPERKPV